MGKATKVKAKAKAKAKAAPVYAANDPTPERMSHGPSEVVAVLRRAGEVITGTGSTRRMTPRIELLYNLGALSWAQWRAGVWWQERYEEGIGNAKVCGDYGQSNGARGSGDPSPLPLSDKAENARGLLDAAKAAISLSHRAAVEDAIDDPHPALVGRQATERCNAWRAGLQALAVHLRLARADDRVPVFFGFT
jgi:hypothetical protein